MSTSDFYCTQCGKKNMVLPRKAGKMKEPGHLKKLFCIYCQRSNNCVEIKAKGVRYQYEDFLFEFSNGNFNTDGTRKMPYGRFKNMIYRNQEAV